MRQVLQQLTEAVGGIVAWTRAVPERVVLGLEERTGLPPGFWAVLGLSLVTAVLATTAVVAGVYSWRNAAPVPREIPSEG